MRLEKQAVPEYPQTGFQPAAAYGPVPLEPVGARPSPKQNHLLASLGTDSYARLLPHLELVPMPQGWAVHEAGDMLTRAYFPTSCIMSLFQIMADGASTAMAIVGNDGLIGTSLFMNGGQTANRAVVLTPGYAFRLKGSVLRKEFALNGDFQRLALGYTQTLLTQTALTAVCSSHHVLGQKLCRLLLLNLDRVTGNELHLTHELIAHNLGVRRESVTNAAKKLQADGLIRCRRGRVTVMNRSGLEERVCECYAAVKNEFGRLLSQKMSTCLQ
jgi:CRP-like cAMP-binding protein